MPPEGGPASLWHSRGLICVPVLVTVSASARRSRNWAIMASTVTVSATTTAEFPSLDLFDININRVRREVAGRIDGRDTQFFTALDLEESDR